MTPRQQIDGLAKNPHAWRRPAPAEPAGQPQPKAVAAMVSEGLAKARARGIFLAFAVGSVLLGQSAEP